MPPSRRAPQSAIHALRAIADSDEQRREALRLLQSSRDPDVARAAIAILGDAADPDLRPALHRAYDAWEQRGDGTGQVRAAVVRALQPIVQEGDLPLLQRALATYQMVGMYEVCAELRAAALVTLNDLDPGLAALYAARFLTDPRNSFSGEPARTAIQLLAAQQNLAPVFGLASWGSAPGETIGDALRNLIDLPAPLLPLLIDQYRDSDDEQILLGLFDLLLGHRTRDDWLDEFARFFRTTSLVDLYGIVAMQIVASRSEPLITLLRTLAGTEPDPTRKSLLDHALELA